MGNKKLLKLHSAIFLSFVVLTQACSEDKSTRVRAGGALSLDEVTATPTPSASTADITSGTDTTTPGVVPVDPSVLNALQQIPGLSALPMAQILAMLNSLIPVIDQNNALLTQLLQQSQAMPFPNPNGPVSSSNYTIEKLCVGFEDRRVAPKKAFDYNDLLLHIDNAKANLSADRSKLLIAQDSTLKVTMRSVTACSLDKFAFDVIKPDGRIVPYEGISRGTAKNIIDFYADVKAGDKVDIRFTVLRGKCKGLINQTISMGDSQNVLLQANSQCQVF